MIPCAVIEGKGNTTISPVNQSLHVLGNVVALSTTIRCELATYILTTHIVYFACHVQCVPAKTEKGAWKQSKNVIH